MFPNVLTRIRKRSPMSLRKAFIGLAATLAIACGSPAGSNGLKEAPKKSFSIGMVTFAGYAPLYLAKEKGFFDDLNVELKRIEEVPSLRAAMASGNLEAYLATPDIALNTNTQPPGKAVWAIDESAGGDGVVVGPGIKSLSELKGKQVAAEPGLPPNFVLMYLLHQNGLSMSDVKFKDMSTQNAAAAFVSSSVDAAGLYEPYLSTSKNQRKGSRVVVSSAQLPGLIVDLVFARQDVIATRQADVDRVIDGWRKAMAFIKTNPDEAYNIMAKSFSLKVPEFRDTVAGIHWLDLSENQTMFGTDADSSQLSKTMTTVVGVLTRNHAETNQTKPASVIDTSFVQRQK
jgi:NitT/TauT family transport system substrate-binding protein